MAKVTVISEEETVVVLLSPSEKRALRRLLNRTVGVGEIDLAAAGFAKHDLDTLVKLNAAFVDREYFTHD